MSSSRSRSRSGPVLRNTSTFSAVGGGGGGATSSAASRYFASSSSSFSSSTFLSHRSTSPTRVHFAGARSSPSASVRFTLDNRPTSPGRSISFVPAKKPISAPSNPNRKTCMCSPTTHPGSFRCSLHKGFGSPSMAGLSVLLESQTPSFPKCPQIISKTNLRSPPSSSSSSHFAPTSPFLEYCYLCRQRLLEGRDIYMYRGDRAFCSEECRCKQIFLDEESVRRDSCSLAAASAATAARRRRKSRPVAGGFA